MEMINYSSKEVDWLASTLCCTANSHRRKEEDEKIGQAFGTGFLHQVGKKGRKRDWEQKGEGNSQPKS